MPFPYLTGLYLPKGSLLLLYDIGWSKYYAELYLGISSNSFRTTRLCTSIVLVPRIKEDGLSVSMYD
jgi:hypothetical protein